MRADILIAEIGSTTTVVNALRGIAGGSPAFAGQGSAPTSVLAGDVRVGLKGAIADLERRLGETVEWGEMFASSSAAGGLRMTVHGLAYDMTVRAAREAALGAGAVLKFVTAGDMTDSDLERVRRIQPNIILLAGGVDYGERATVVGNARRLAALGLACPVIYAGNVAVRDEVEDILRDAGCQVIAVDNVYPRIDVLNVEPTRRAIQRAFEQHIVHAPGMDRVRDLVTGTIIPTPGAVMNMARVLKEDIGDLVVVDVGGATTDVHSVTEGSDEINRMLVSPEPVAKRTVEGDLGVYVNAANVYELLDPTELAGEFSDPEALLRDIKPIPTTPDEIRFAERLTETATFTAVSRHAGTVQHLYGPSGRTTIARGKDLSRVKWIIGTGGALTRLPNGAAILGRLRDNRRGREMWPSPEAEVLLDHDYIMASLGTLASRYPEAALSLIKQSLRLVPRET
ncbi:MAG: GlmL-related ornithine degradation protein [Chloroflexota bacterium]